jgi:hypothetical protein
MGGLNDLQRAIALARDKQHRYDVRMSRFMEAEEVAERENRDLLLREINAWFGSSFEFNKARQKRLGVPPANWHSAKLATGESTHRYFDEPRMKAASEAVRAGYVFS